jgi:uncharacterized protein
MIWCPAHAVSFDCRRAGTSSDAAICSTPTLSAKDDELDRVYSQLMEQIERRHGDVRSLIMDERQWLVMRNTCAGDRGCINNWYDRRIAGLRQMLEAAGPAKGGTQVQIPSSPNAEAERAEAQKKYDDAVAAHQEQDKERGYQATGFDDFQGMGKALASSSAKVAVQGMYVKLGEVEFLMPSQDAIQSARQSGRTDQGIGLLTDKAGEGVKRLLLGCRNNSE